MTTGNASGGAWLTARAVCAVTAALLALAGCVSAPPRPSSPWPPTAGYAPPLPEYRPPFAGAAPRIVYPPQATLHPYRPQPAVQKPEPADPPATVEPPPLQPVDPVGTVRVDDGCAGSWRICHFF